MNKSMLLLFLLLVSLLHTPFIATAYEVEGQVSLIVKSSSQSLHQTVLKVKSENLVRALFQAKPLEAVQEVPFSNHYVLLEDRGTIRVFSLDVNGDFYDVQKKEILQIAPSATKKIISYFEGLQQHHFGTLLNWEEVDEIIPRYTTFTITDLETGLRFQAQRRAGNNHADVQPLTRADTAIMKDIYGGKWSWNRRAILVSYKGHIIAASMHGMPHGGGALANAFPGHFCIHFKDSLTHSTRSLDLTHQIMVYKAGGILSPFVQQLSARDVVETFFIALNQQDLDLLNLIYSDDSTRMEQLIEEVEFIRLTKKKNPPSLRSDLVYEIPLAFIVKKKGEGEVNSFYTFQLKRESPTDAWKLTQIPAEL